MLRKPYNIKQIITIIYVILFVLSFFYSMNHFTNGGCDGGTCGILLFFYSIPLIFAWLFSIISLNLGFHGKWTSVIFLILSIGITSWLVFMDFDISELKIPGYILYASQLLSLGVFIKKTTPS